MVPPGISVEPVPNSRPGGTLRSVESRNRWGADLTTGAGVNNEGGSRIVFQDKTRLVINDPTHRVLQL